MHHSINIETRRKFYKLTFYNILANITVPLTGLVDTSILGNLNTYVFMAGAALSGIIFDFMFWMFGFLRMGTTGLTAQAIGEKNEKESIFILIRSISLACFFGTMILILSPWIREIGFQILEGSSEVKTAGVSYFDARISGSIAVLCNYVFTGWFLGRGKSSIVLIGTLVGNGINILLDVWFILKLGWEAYGAGLATSISQFGMLFVFISSFFIELKIQNILKFLLSNNKSLFSVQGFSSLLHLNKDIFLRTLFLIVTFSVFRNFSSEAGTEILAANSILLQLILVSAYLVDGAAFATESLAGNIYGKKNWKLLKELLYLAFYNSIFFTSIFLGFVFLFPNLIFGMITKSDRVFSLLIDYRFWLFPVLEVGAIAFILDGFFIGLTKGKILRNSMLISTAFFFFPIVYLGKIQKDNHLLWFSLVLLMVGRALTLSFQAKKFFEKCKLT
ncbi:MATE family efflux transporter [Leptospira kirschneri]|uniref:MATE family efflux transporter n=1 Tax=Leptospira kirschneri TaxID=29507 RepID=UPI0002895907|nr:MATE family efflux transporter [Leptospira kirschneri]EMK15172.1 MATE efflux family protein [Leptospira kirschneri serovar Bim str. PUO 1247]EMN06731.1 MATE efflux family protein [Leptospira kirschneri serovar Bim str. 1051]KON77716.1 MATE efflux family protein [Leptospira kirschneri serovar Mozdok]KPZ77891.1 MATE family efflux transporter [Leptospira kirschneri serovar Mozdok]NDK06871.1 Multidrug resistance protein, MATE family [Leptospira kirschneri serovar Mozdok]